MNEETNSSPPLQPNQDTPPQVEPTRPSAENVIQASPNITQEPKAQQQVQTNTPLPSVSNPQAQPPAPSVYPASNRPGLTTPSQMQVGVSASQLGLHGTKSKFFDFNPKQLIIKGVIALVILGGIFIALVMTNLVALSEFKNIGYSNSKGTSFKLDFYTKHGSEQLESGNKQLISKVSKRGKLPITLLISTTDDTNGYYRTKDCSGFSKVFDVQNNKLNQQISICSFGETADAVYVAGFKHNDKTHIITIGQDYGSVDISSPSGAQESLAKFGIGPYRADIERIVSSIEVE